MNWRDWLIARGEERERVKKQLRVMLAILTVLIGLYVCLPAFAHRGWHIGYNEATDRYCATSLIVQWCGRTP